MQPIVRNSARALRSASASASTSTSTSTSRTASVAARCLSSTASVRAAAAHEAEHDGHESHYDAPTGWLWGVKPGEKYEKEGWEGIMYWGFGGSVLLGVVGYAFKPDTSIQTWALEEARRRLEAEGILKEPADKQ